MSPTSKQSSNIEICCYSSTSETTEVSNMNLTIIIYVFVCHVIPNFIAWKSWHFVVPGDKISDGFCYHHLVAVVHSGCFDHISLID